MIENKKHNLNPLTRVIHIPESSDIDILGMSNPDDEWFNKANRKRVKKILEVNMRSTLFPFFGENTDEINKILVKKIKKYIKNKARVGSPHFTRQ